MSKLKPFFLGMPCIMILASQIAIAAELTLVRFGPTGQEKPGLIDSQGGIRDPSGHISDITPAMLTDQGLEQIASIPVNDLPEVAGEPRLGVPRTGIGKIVATGFNYVNHAAEMEVQLPTEPLTFMKATSALTGPFDSVIQPRNGQKSMARCVSKEMLQTWYLALKKLSVI